MITVNVITSICFALLTAWVAYVVISCICKTRAERIDFVRSFKMGKCLAIFVIAIPLICVGYYYNGLDLVHAISNGLPHVFGFVKLDFDLESIAPLLDASLFYRITVYYCCVLVVINAVLFTFSILGQRLWFWSRAVRIKLTKKSKLYIFGYGDNSVSIYKSAKDHVGVIVADVKGENRNDCYKSKIGLMRRGNDAELVDKLCRGVLKKSNKVVVVINTEDDESNLLISRAFAERIKKTSDADKDKLFERLGIYVFGSPRLETIFDGVIRDCSGCAKYQNKYSMIATDFIDRYPLTMFLDERHIDRATALIKPDVNINVCMIGFGEPNRRILLTSVANNQFLTADKKGGATVKKVDYHIFDKDSAQNNKNLNHSYYRFKHELAEAKGVNKKDYLELPELPAAEHYHQLDINDERFYDELKKIVTAGANDINCFIVSFDDDLNNIDLTQKLIEKRREWGLEDRLVIFVRVKKPYSKHSVRSAKNVYHIGVESECVYNLECITNDRIYRMARMRNEIYRLVREISKNEGAEIDGEFIKRNRSAADREWFCTLSSLERKSNLYGCLSLRSKLNMIGFDYCEANDGRAAVTEKEYLARYGKGDMPDIVAYDDKADGKPVIRYSLDFPRTLRSNMATLEHYRWNAYMITSGIVPATKEQILSDTVCKDGKVKLTNGKNYGLRRHGNLTTMDGLVEFRKMIAARDGVSEESADVIKYDYQLMDEAFWLLSKCGYKIVDISGAAEATEAKP